MAKKIHIQGAIEIDGKLRIFSEKDFKTLKVVIT